jgi:hypothetical protein
MTNIKSADLTDNVSKIILRLGEFHTVTSFLGSIGHVMNGSGLRQVMDLIYAEDTVAHLLSGKAISRGIRAHFLIDAALNILLLKNMFDNENNDDEVLFTSLNIQEKLERQEEIDNLLKQPTTIEGMEESANVEKLKKIIILKLNSLMSHRTTTMWLQYMEMVGILKTFSRAERTGHFLLFLKTIYSKCCPI